MNIRSFLLTAFTVAATINTTKAQLINNGGIITVQNGAYITVMGELQNNTGTITNDGKIEVQGNFTNTASYNSTSNEDSLIFKGAGTSLFNAGGATINYLTINKTASTDIVKLAASLNLSKKLDFVSGIFTTDPITNPTFAVVSPTSAAYIFAAGTEIIGSVKRTGWANGAANVFNQTNMLVTTAAGTAPTDVTVTMLPQTGGGNPTQNEREVTRSYKFAQTGGTGFTADIRYPYLTSELNTNTEANLVPWKLASSEWNSLTATATRDVVNHYVNYTGIPAADLALDWKLADPKYTFNVNANLRGSWNGSTAMSTALNSGGILPLSHPYNVTPFNYTGTESVASIPNANVVDWVLIEHRKPSTGLATDALSSTITGRKAAFLLNDGSVVELDGVTPVTVDITKQGTAFITLRHRNHLGVLSNAIASNAAGTFANDFNVLANSYMASGAASNPVVLLAGATGKYGLWAGDANKSGTINGTDISAIKSAVANSLTGYLLTDVNLSNSINGTDVSVTKAIISASATGSNPARQASTTTTKPIKVISNIPDPISE
jgi:hypothetical protein